MKRKATTVIDALVGLMLAAVCLVLVVLHLSGRLLVDADMLMFLFLAGGVGAGIGLFFVHRLVPRRVQTSLFADSGGIFLQPAALDEISAKSAELPTKNPPAATAIQVARPTDLGRNNNRRGSIPRYVTREGLGTMGLVIVFLLASALPVRLPIGWGFLWVGIAGGGAVALVLSRLNHASTISNYAIPVAGGVVGALVMLGIGAVMMRFHFLRDFLGMAVGGGTAVAWFLRWSRSRNDSKGSFIQGTPEAAASHVTMQAE